VTCRGAAIVAKVTIVGLVSIRARIEWINPGLVEESGSGNNSSRLGGAFGWHRRFDIYDPR
jgi:hypothetical protein